MVYGDRDWVTWRVGSSEVEQNIHVQNITKSTRYFPQVFFLSQQKSFEDTFLNTEEKVS